MEIFTAAHLQFDDINPICQGPLYAYAPKSTNRISGDLPTAFCRRGSRNTRVLFFRTLTNAAHPESPF